MYTVRGRLNFAAPRPIDHASALSVWAYSK